MLALPIRPGRPIYLAVAAGLAGALLAVTAGSRPASGGLTGWLRPAVSRAPRPPPAPALVPPLPASPAVAEMPGDDCGPPGPTPADPIAWLEQDFDSCGTGGCVYRVYVPAAAGTARTTTAHGAPATHFAGTVAGRCISLVSGPRGRPADILTTWRLGCCESIDTRYRFSHGRYREYRKRTCTTDGCGRWHRAR